MKNNYIRLFEELAEEKPNTLKNISLFENIGFFLTDFERLHEEKFIFLEKHKGENTKIRFHVKLAPRGFASLEEYNKNQRQEQINHRTLKATIIIAIATALNVLVTLFAFTMNLEESNWVKFTILIVLGIPIAGLSGILIKEILYFLVSKKNKNDQTKKINNPQKDGE